MKYVWLGMVSLLMSACSSIPTHSPAHLVGQVETGKASYYAMKYQFRTTASGERYSLCSVNYLGRFSGNYPGRLIPIFNYRCSLPFCDG
ncbi:MAG: lipoprotein, partial [Idiomarina sp. T82-3]